MTAQSGQSTNSIDHSVFIFQLLIVILVIVVTAAASAAVVVASALPCLHRPQFQLFFFPSGARSYTLATRTSTNTNHIQDSLPVCTTFFSASFHTSLLSFHLSHCVVCVCVCVCVSFPATVIGVVSAHCCRRCYRSLKEASHTSSRRTRHGSFTSIWRTASSSHRTAALP